MRRAPVLAATMFVALIVLFASSLISIQRMLFDTVHVFDGSCDIPSKQKVEPLAWNIVQKSFRETYAVLEDECRNVESLLACMRTLRAKDYSIHSFPWWFRTLLRDSTDRKVLHAGWHNITLTEPSLQVCAIEKIGCTEWKRLQCAVHDKVPGKGVDCEPDVMPKEPPPRMVILRDPLERFLSAFTDKCLRRVGEMHCEPLDVFHQQKDMTEASRRDRALTPDIAAELKTDDQLFFESYVDTMPLRWNVHFFPMGL